jgi:hypothetical protein
MKIAFLGSIVAAAVALALAGGAGAAERAGDPLSGLPPPPEPPPGVFRMRGFALADEAVQKVGLDLSVPKDPKQPARGTLMIGSWRYSLQAVKVRRGKQAAAKRPPSGGPGGPTGPVRSIQAGLFALPPLVLRSGPDDVLPPAAAGPTPATTGTAKGEAGPGRKDRRARGRKGRRVERVGDLELYTVERTYGVAPVEILRGRARIGRLEWDLVGSPGKAKP